MKFRKIARCAGVLGALGAIALVSPALAQEAAPAAAPAPTLDSGDTAWMLTSSVIVLMMSLPGLALFYGGMVRKKNILNTSLMVFATVCLMSIIWTFFGYSLAFTDGGEMNAYIGGLSKAMLAGVTKDSLQGTIPEALFVFFQMTFAAITPALIIGAVVDRMKFSTLLVFMCLWLVIVYLPVCHWVWGGGFLSKDGVLDFAGGTVVHINAGIAGLVACIMVGRRKGYGHENMMPHNLVLTMIGASLLWVGWFGFNAGSAVSAGTSASMAALATQVATAAAALGWMFTEWLIHRKPTILGITSGAVAGLVAITPAAGFVDAKGAMLIGLAAGVGCYFAATTLKKALGYDDSLDVFGVHGVGGIIGALLTGVFAVKEIGGTAGVLEGNAAQFGIQVYGVLATIIWCAVATFVILLVLKVIMGLRVPEDVEIEGLDARLHGETVP
ncbi:ammonia channel protein [Hyphomicrobium methylovorum]|uniref:ammonium transporter n=1 Tax=Hyphomicrobium methylovorum TaxID=84 RepID=UPI0015E6AD34|nr:ammonium transporter [Hyphomicrobium methylovorum]MBA2126163.1 ammonia channel protein [Hyphomicrobium methylovorum]